MYCFKKEGPIVQESAVSLFDAEGSMSAVFSFDDLHWSERAIALVKEEAEACCREHKGDIELVEGNVSYIHDEPFYANPESWPRYIVSWEA